MVMPITAGNLTPQAIHQQLPIRQLGREIVICLMNKLLGVASGCECDCQPGSNGFRLCYVLFGSADLMPVGDDQIRPYTLLLFGRDAYRRACTGLCEFAEIVREFCRSRTWAARAYSGLVSCAWETGYR